MLRNFYDDPISLGFSKELPESELFRLRSHYFPLGKIGGKPAWLNPIKLPKPEELECKVCKKPMCFCLQVYATSNNDPPHSFHRTLFVFVCKNPECSQEHDASNIAVFRCALPRQNPFYSPDDPLDPDLAGDIPDPYATTDYPQLCSICGGFASKKCGKCLRVWYCSRDHQALDWASHKKLCAEGGATEEGAVNPFTFKEHAIEMDQEYVASDLFEGISDSEDDCEDEKEADIKRRLADYNNFLNSRSDKEEIAGGDEEEDEKDQKDVAFLKFSRLVELNPDQILRYVRGGEPLPATLKAPPLSSPPNCEICGGARSFEMQLMPNLLSILELDSIGKSVDWASIYIYTCANSCNIPDLGYAREFVIKHDFAS